MGGAESRQPVRAGVAQLDRALDLSGLDAPNAHVHALGVTLDQGTDALDVWIPTTGRTAVRVRDLHPETRTTTTNITDGCHKGAESSEQMTTGQQGHWFAAR